MAGIEKICEVTGECCGWPMYGWKTDLIQVMPKCRCVFKGQSAELFFFTDPELVQYAESKLVFTHIGFGKFQVMVPMFWTSRYWHWRKWGSYCEFPDRVWTYALYVPDVRGRVNGLYTNTTRNPRRAVRKLSKLVGKGNMFLTPIYGPPNQAGWDQIDAFLQETGDQKNDI